MTTTGAVGLGTFYKFLASQNINSGADMVEKMDGCWAGDEKNGVVVAGEFRTFIKENWNFFDGLTPTDDEITQFWCKLDTTRNNDKVSGTDLHNKNALDDKEMAKVETQMAAYEVINNFINGDVSQAQIINGYLQQLRTLGVVIDQRKFLDSITQSLMETGMKVIADNPNASADEIRELVQQALENSVQAAANKTVANMVAQVEIEAYNSLIPGLDNYAFEDLQELISSYIKTRVCAQGFNGDFAQIRDEIRYILNQYYTAAGVQQMFDNLDGVDTNALSPYVLNNSGNYSDLQTQVINKKLNEGLANIGNSNWDDVAKYREQYKEMYINYLKSNKTFAEIIAINDIGEDFLNFRPSGSAVVKTLMNLHYDAEHLGDLDWVFRQALCGFDGKLHGKKITDVFDVANFQISALSITGNNGNILDDGLIHTEDENYNYAVNNMGINPDYGYTPALADYIRDYMCSNNSLINEIHNAIMSGEITSKSELYDYAVKVIQKYIDQIVNGKNLTINDHAAVYKASVSSAEDDSSITNDERTAKVRAAAIRYCDVLSQKGSYAVDAIKEVFGDNYSQAINNMNISTIKDKMDALITEVKKLNARGAIFDKTPTGTSHIESVSIDTKLVDNVESWNDAKNNSFMPKIRTIAKRLKDAAIEDGYDERRAYSASQTFIEYYNYAMDAISSYGSTNDPHLSGEEFGYTDHLEGKWVTTSDQSRVMGDDNHKLTDDHGNVGYDDPSDTGIYMGVDIDGWFNGPDNYYVFVKPETLKAKFISFLH